MNRENQYTLEFYFGSDWVDAFIDGKKIYGGHNINIDSYMRIFAKYHNMRIKEYVADVPIVVISYVLNDEDYELPENINKGLGESYYEDTE